MVTCRYISAVGICSLLLSAAVAAAGEDSHLVLVEAESFSDLGGWVVDQQFMDQMGSPYVLAHGLGVPVPDGEWIRDLNPRAMYDAWDTLKNVDKLYPNHRLKWAAFIGGKRESRRLLGDVVLTADDFRKASVFDDAAFPCTWHIDIHSAHPDFFSEDDPNAFLSTFTRGKEYRYEGPYWAPYRCLYSRNIDNLFMAGRDISVSHDGLGAVRVMRTCGMMGEVVGMAASICRRHNCNPRDVYESYLAELKELMRQGAGKTATTSAGSRQE